MSWGSNLPLAPFHCPGTSIFGIAIVKSSERSGHNDLLRINILYRSRNRVLLVVSGVLKMTHQLTQTEKVVLAGALLLGNALPTVARAQAPMLFQVNKDVVAKPLKPSVFALYHVSDPSHCIGIYNGAAVPKGEDAVTPAGLRNAAELQNILDSGPVVNDKHYLPMALYKGPPLQLGDCNIAQAGSNSSSEANQVATPLPSKFPTAQAAVSSQMNALMNSVRLQVNSIEADAKKATIKITDSHNNNYVMKIEPANALQAIGSTYRQGLRGSSASAGDGFSGKDYKVSINGSFARFYKPDGTPEEAKEDRSNLGSGTTSAVMREWNGSDLKAIADAVTEKVKASTGKEPDYANVLRSLSNKETGAPPSTFVPASGGHP
jgi:hypothetical protein